jgi:hypothetical protein
MCCADSTASKQQEMIRFITAGPHAHATPLAPSLCPQFTMKSVILWRLNASTSAAAHATRCRHRSSTLPLRPMRWGWRPCHLRGAASPTRVSWYLSATDLRLLPLPLAPLFYPTWPAAHQILHFHLKSDSLSLSPSVPPPSFPPSFKFLVSFHPASPLQCASSPRSLMSPIITSPSPHL